MESTNFSNSFYFVNYRYQKSHYRDYRAGTDTHYFGWLKRGSVRLVSDSGTVEAGPGELFYIPKGCRYQSYWTSDDDINLFSFGFRSYPGEGQRHFCLQKVDITPEVEKLLNALSEDMRVGCRSVGYLCLLMACCEEQMEAETSNRHGGIADNAVRYMYAVDRFAAEEAAAYCGVGVSTLYQAFRKTFGKTPVAVWHEVQTRKAVELLVTTDLSIEEISSRLGFSSSSYFRKIFSEQTGATPRSIRKKGELSAILGEK